MLLAVEVYVLIEAYRSPIKTYTVLRIPVLGTSSPIISNYGRSGKPSPKKGV